MLIIGDIIQQYNSCNHTNICDAGNSDKKKISIKVFLNLNDVLCTYITQRPAGMLLLCGSPSLVKNHFLACYKGPK